MYLMSILLYLMSILLCLMSILLYLSGQATATQTFQEEPSDVTVNLGDNVTLSCKVSNRRGKGSVDKR
jgi:hypothetical protein